MAGSFKHYKKRICTYPIAHLNIFDIDLDPYTPPLSLKKLVCPIDIRECIIHTFVWALTLQGDETVLWYTLLSMYPVQTIS